MKRLEWPYFAAALVLFAVLFPWARKACGRAGREIQFAKSRLALSKDLIAHRDDYVLWQKELEVKGEVLWGSADPVDFAAELQKVSDTVKVPIQRIKPRPGNAGDSSVAAELAISGDMNSIGKFLYEALRLPGLVSVETFALTGSGQEGGLTAELYISRKVYTPK